MIEKLTPDVRWISVAEAAEILKVAPNTVRARIERGEIPTIGEYTWRKAIILDRRIIEALAAADRPVETVETAA